MRELTRFTEPQIAQALSDVLLTQGIQSRVEASREGRWVVWIYDENQLPAARLVCEQFVLSPDDPRYADASREAAALRANAQEVERRRPKIIQVRDRFLPKSYGLTPVSVALIGVSVLVAVLTRLGEDGAVLQLLSFASYDRQGGSIFWDGVSQLRAGQLHRLVTPIFLHFGPAHLIFNMWWLKDLGAQIERRQSPWFLAGLILVLAAASNSAQYLMSGPAFGGMSGVVYGLFGYIWMRGRFDPASGYFLSPRDVSWMLIWLVVCFTGLVGPIANTAHTVGLAAGAAWGYLASRGLRR